MILKKFSRDPRTQKIAIVEIELKNPIFRNRKKIEYLGNKEKKTERI